MAQRSVPKQGLTEPEVSLGGVVAWSWLAVAGHETEAEQSGGRAETGACRDGGGDPDMTAFPNMV